MKGLTTVILTILCGPLIACVCDNKETVKESFDRYPVIFQGRVIDISIVPYSTALRDEQLKSIREKLKGEKTRLERFESEKIQKITFQIIQTIKGDSATSTITIFTHSGTSCDIDFKKNKDYLVYGALKGFNDNKYVKQADGNMKFTKDSFFWTQFCSRTRLFSEQEKKQLIEIKNG